MWWQCICLAYAWDHQLDANALRQGTYFQNLEMDFRGFRSMGWLKEFAGDCKEDAIDAEFVTLAKLGKLFEALS